jgi:hypothetical protein
MIQQQEQHVDWEAPAALASVLCNDSNKRCIDLSALKFGNNGNLIFMCFSNAVS